MAAGLNRNFSAMTRYAFAVLAVIAASFLRWAFSATLGTGTPFILFFPTVVLVGWFGGLWPGLLSVVLSSLIAWYVFIPPAYSLELSDPTGLVQLIVFCLAGTLISLLAESLHQAKRRSQEREISEREHAERFRVTLDSIGDAVIATDVDGRVTLMNPVAESLSGRTRDESIGKPLDQVLKIVNEENRQPVENPALRALKDGGIVGFGNHSVLISKDGTEHAIDDTAAPIRMPSGTAGAILVFRDVGQRRKAEREIWQSRETLKTTLNSIGDAVVTTDAKGRITYINPVANKLLGISLEQASGRSSSEVYKIVNEYTRQAVENPVERVLRDGNATATSNEALLLRADGTEIAIDDSAATILDHSGRTVGVVLVFRDVTDRRRTQKAQATLAAIVESSQDAIISKDLDGRITTWNAGAERLFGYREEEAIGRHITLIIPPNQIEEEAAILSRIRRGERLEHYETVRVRKDGTHVDISLTVSPVRASDGKITGASKIARDITDQKMIERQLIDADRHKDNFLAILAHELRNPLGPIRNAAKIIELQRPDDPELLACCELIDKEVVQITRLLDDLLDVSRITRGKFSLHKEPIDVGAVVKRAVETSTPLIDEAGHRLTVNLPSAPLIIQGDPIRLAQVFSNLFNNAAKFTRSGGDIRVDVARQGDQVLIKVKDSGVGIAQDLLPRIFDMFVQGSTVTERSNGGLGLGLTLSRDIVEFHGGNIEVLSAGPGQGSEFIVSLPLSTLSLNGVDGSDPAQITSMNRQTRTRIVVIDDNKNQAQSLKKLLEAIGHDVRVAYDGSAAMKLLANFVPDFALVDIGLPKISGYELAQWMREQSQFRNVILIAQTGWGREQDRNHARDAGFDHHLVKPIDHQRLLQILEQPRSIQA